MPIMQEIKTENMEIYLKECIPFNSLDFFNKINFKNRIIENIKSL